MWAYTLLIPYFVQAGLLGSGIMQDGLFGLALLRPESLFYLDLDPLTHGVIWSMLVNIAAYVAVSMLRAPEPIERLQANLFIEGNFAARPARPSFRAWRTSVTVGDLMRTVGALSRRGARRALLRRLCRHAAKAR